MSDAQRLSERTLLDQITTDWSHIADPARFVLRYAPAIRAYLLSFFRGGGDSDDVTQDFLARVLVHGFAEQQVTRGRFRDYLRAAVRNAAFDHLRKKRIPTLSNELLDDRCASEDCWLAEWRACLLEKALQRLELHERRFPRSLYYTVLRLSIDRPEANSQELVQLTTQACGRRLTAAGLRQQLGRARRRLAEILVDEVRQTLRDPSPADIREELQELGLYCYVEGYFA